MGWAGLGWAGLGWATQPTNQQFVLPHPCRRRDAESEEQRRREAGLKDRLNDLRAFVDVLTVYGGDAREPADVRASEARLRETVKELRAQLEVGLGRGGWVGVGGWGSSYKFRPQSKVEVGLRRVGGGGGRAQDWRGRAPNSCTCFFYTHTCL
jgi:hypothetical protein